ncbi:polysaccharide pyruvyl transferase family protein [Aliivibrio wodanis]|uniref:polysaccharide pyruvyl transferase family protein n=1 Tax=Aliivibrio wodanis TaxID=80852 RepID=UPI00406CBBAC
MSIGPFENKFDKWFTKKVLKKLNDIYTRESYSEKLADEMKLSPKYCHDLAWLSDGDVLDVDCSWMGHFVGTVICWNYPGKNKNIMRERYINNYLDAVDILVEYSGKPFVIYNQVGDGSGASLDEILIEEMIQRARGKIIYDSSALDPSVLKSRMKGCEGVIASRFHSALFSIQVLTPFCSIAYQPKAEFILKDLNLSKFCFTIDNFDGKELAYDLIRFSQARLDVERKLIIAQEETLNNINTTILTKLKSVLS